MNSETSPLTFNPDAATHPQVPILRSPMPEVPGHEVLELIGRGGMGKVYRARQIALGRIVAVKLLAQEPDEKSLSRFREEYRAVARLQHPNIAQLFESGAAEGRPYFTQEYIEGGTLANHYGGIPQDPMEAAKMVETIARAIHYSHEQGILHRDLKPGNILLTGRGEPKVTDFGLAKDFAAQTGDTPVDSGGGLTRTGEILGTPSYMPPEQASGVVSGIGPTADIYSLGAILYEALTGRPPFQGPDPLQTLFMVLSMEPVAPRVLLPKLPRDIETICLKCLEKSPKKRYASAGELADELKRFRNREPILARPVGRWERAVKWSRRNKALAALAVLAVMFVGLLFTIGLMGLGVAVIQKDHATKIASANKDLTIAQGDLERTNASLRQSKEESDRSFALAKSALDDIVRNLGFQLHGVPKAEGALMETLRKAAGFYRQLCDLRPDDPANAERYSAALSLLAANQTAFGDYASARKTVALQDDFLNRELEKFPDNVELLTMWTRLAFDRMSIAQVENPPADASAARKEFIRRAEAFIARYPDKAVSRSFGVQRYWVIAKEAEVSDKHAERFKALNEGLASARKFVNDFPELSSGYLFVGTTLDHLGMAHLDRKENDEADKRFEELEQYYLLAVNVNLGEDTRQGGIAHAKLKRGDIAYDRGKFQQAFDFYTAAEGLYRKLAENFPKMSQHRVSLAYALFWGGFMLKDADREGCLMKVDEAIRIMDGLAKDDPSQASTLETYRTGRKGLTP